MSKIIFTRGIQGSGKTTWAKQWCIDHPDWVRVSRDDLRNMRGQYWLPKDEKMITLMEEQLIMKALESGKNVIVDAMNLNNDRTYARVDQWRNDGWFDGNIGFEDFTNVPLEECQRRNLIRPNSIDPAVIQRTWDKYLAPPKVAYVEDPALPHCIIVDVDGTLAEMNGRSPYEWDRVGEDLPKQSIVDLTRHLSGAYEVIIFTGRDGSCLPATESWLKSQGVIYDQIYIRPEGDTRKDSIVKREMFEENIRGKCYVDFVLDDRDQVVDMWRKDLGLTCLQVDYGNF